MKKIILLVVLLIVIIPVFFLYHRSTSPSGIVEKQADISIEQNILLYPLSGEVTFKATPNDTFQQATASPTIIPNQAIVHTNIGKASVLLPDNSTISLENNTEITVNYSKKTTSIYQGIGTTYHRVEKLLSGSTYQVQTAGTLAAVRGTKFAVKYDTKSKKTKIAVTENKVEVATLPKTPDVAIESMLVESGKTISVEIPIVTEGQAKPSLLSVVDTNNDTEMRGIVETENKIDKQLEVLKKESSDEQDFRKKMKRVLFNDIKEDISSQETQQDGGVLQKSDEQKKVQQPETVTTQKTSQPEEVTTKPKEEVTKPKEETTKPVIKEPIIITKMGEEEFFTTFESLFIKYFYIDDTDDSVCTVNVTPQERVNIVTKFAESKGYSFVKTTLLSFAEAIDTYCARKDKDVKAKLQARFDDEYPF